MSHSTMFFRTVTSRAIAVATAPPQQQQCRRMMSTAVVSRRSTNSNKNNNVLLGLISSSFLWLPSGMMVTLCEDKSFLDKIVKKDADGNTDWAKSASQITEADFWDKIATASGDKIQTAYDTGIPSQLSYGFACGFCSGYALRSVGRGAAVVLGMGFMSLQTLSYYGYIHVDHAKFQDDFNRAMDLNKDGKVDHDDAKLAYGKIQEVLQYSLPAGGGFAGGFAAGLRRG